MRDYENITSSVFEYRSFFRIFIPLARDVQPAITSLKTYEQKTFASNAQLEETINSFIASSYAVDAEVPVLPTRPPLSYTSHALYLLSIFLLLPDFVTYSLREASKYVISNDKFYTVLDACRQLLFITLHESIINRIDIKKILCQIVHLVITFVRLYNFSSRISQRRAKRLYVSTLRIADERIQKAAIRCWILTANTWRKAGTVISRRLSPFSFRVASMLSRGGKSLRRDHCAPTRSHDCHIATHRRRLFMCCRRDRHR